MWPCRDAARDCAGALCGAAQGQGMRLGKGVIVGWRRGVVCGCAGVQHASAVGHSGGPRRGALQGRGGAQHAAA